MLQDIRNSITSKPIVVIRCKDCDQIVKKNSLHFCQKTGITKKVELGAYKSDSFYKDKGLTRD